MRIIALAVHLEHPNVEVVSFRSMQSMLDYDAAILDPMNMLDGYGLAYPPTYRGQTSISGDDSPRLLADVTRRRNEIAEMTALGRTVVIFTPDGTSCTYDTGQRQYSGTGRSRVTTTIVSDLALKSVIPLKLELTSARGSAIALEVGDPFAAFWRRVREHMEYRATIDSTNTISATLLTVRGTKKSVGLVVRTKSGGSLYLLPTITYPGDLTHKQETAIDAEFVEALLELIRATSMSAEDPPNWLENFTTSTELVAKAELDAVQGQIDELLTTRDERRSVLAHSREPKRLIVGTGAGLEAAVRAAFESLGAVVSEGRPGRTDFVVTCEAGTAVVEVKGVTGSAAEAHAAQLEKWVAEHVEEHGAVPKAILVANTFRDLPPPNRPDPFPTQMLPYATKRGHCLMTGLQLLGATAYADGDPARAKAILDKMFATEGVFDEFSDWSPYLTGPAPVAKAPRKGPSRAAGKPRAGPARQ